MLNKYIEDFASFFFKSEGWSVPDEITSMRRLIGTSLTSLVHYHWFNSLVCRNSMVYFFYVLFNNFLNKYMRSCIIYFDMHHISWDHIWHIMTFNIFHEIIYDIFWHVSYFMTSYMTYFDISYFMIYVKNMSYMTYFDMYHICCMINSNGFLYDRRLFSQCVFLWWLAVNGDFTRSWGKSRVYVFDESSIFFSFSMTIIKILQKKYSTGISLVTVGYNNSLHLIAQICLMINSAMYFYWKPLLKIMKIDFPKCYA